MALQSAADAVAGTMKTLWEANGDYENLKADQDLAPAFHKTGQLILPVGRALYAMQIWLQQHTLDGDSDVSQIARIFGECGQKAEALRVLFRELVAESDTPRKDRYLKYVREKGEGHAAEVLMLNIMKDMCRATKHSSTFGSAMQEQVQQLQAAMADLAALPPSVPPEHGFGHMFSSAGPQFNNTGLGMQFNNTGAGRQYKADVMNFGTEG